MDANRLKQLLSRDEGPKLDFKAHLSLKTEGEKKELAKDICAIANSRGGRGFLIYGVEDGTKKVLGVNPKHFSEEKIQQIVSSRCAPPIPIRIDLVLYQQKHVAVITIFRSNQRPHQLRETGSFHLRRGSTSDIAQRAEIASMLQETGLITHELTMVPRANLEHLCLDSIFKLNADLNPSDTESILLHLEHKGYIVNDLDTNQIYPTVGGLLLFGNNLNDLLPHVAVNIVQTNPFTSLYLSGSILSILDQFEEYLATRELPFDIPTTALNEALANALVHRDYWQLQYNIVVAIKKGQISITNPGCLMDASSLYKGKVGFNHPVRNPWLFKNLLLLDPKKRFLRSGLGLKKIREHLEHRNTRVKFINLPNKNIFKVVFYQTKKSKKS